MIFGQSVFKSDVAPLDISGFGEASVECGHELTKAVHGRAVEKTDHRHRRLRSHGEWPCCYAAEHRDKLAPPHSITSSASCWSCAGTLRPKALAVFRLMTSSNLVGCWTGNSAGWAPLRILSKYGAVCRARSARLAPYDISPPSSAPSLAA